MEADPRAARWTSSSTLLRDPAVRARLVEAAHRGDYGHAIGAEAREPDYDLIQVLEQPVPPNPHGGRGGAAGAASTRSS